MKHITKFIPNLITLLNLSAGTLAVVYAIDGDLGRAAVFILIAAVFDFFDGLAARLLKAYSDIGRELDSLADVVSFGVAPAMIFFTLMELAIFGENLPLQQISGELIEWLFLLCALMIPAFSAYRLAKFNTDSRQAVIFFGLPTPANAILWASFGLMSGFSGNEKLLSMLFTPGNLVVTAVITSLLLVSEIPMFSLKFSGLQFYNNWYRYIFLLAALTLIILAGIYAPVLIILLYISFSISFYLLKVDI
jgi:CDP-diacylglycerol---serine O-phosphatidyltransferase